MRAESRLYATAIEVMIIGLEAENSSQTFVQIKDFTVRREHHTTSSKVAEYTRVRVAMRLDKE